MDLVIGFAIGAVISLITAFFTIKFISKSQADKFQILANEIFEKNSATLKNQAKEDLSNIVNPLNIKVSEYKEYLDHMHKFDLKDRESLREKLSQMLESANKIETEASQLTRALSSDVKFQGAWGELTLERILELAGLQKNVEYFTQESFKDEDGKSKRPDVIIKLPNDSQIIIDSKVSLKSYFDYVNSDNKAAALKALKQSIQTHIDSLAKKNYQKLEGLNSPDFVYLFIPVEGVYSLMIKEYPELIDESLKKNIVLASPVNIISNLKTVASLWRLEKQSKNAKEMAQKAGAMYDKFVLFLDDFQKVGLNIQRAQDAHGEMTKKLSEGKGNLIVRAEELKSLGAKTSKDVDSNYLN